MRVRAVIDTNVIVSALIKPNGTARALWDLLCQGNIMLVFSPELIDEIAAVLSHPKIRAKYRTSPKDIEAIAALFALRGDMVTIKERIRLCRDPQDDFLLETAVSGKAGFIVSGDADLLALKKSRNIKIIKPAAFMTMLHKKRR